MSAFHYSKYASLLALGISVTLAGCTGSNSSTPQGYVAPETQDDLPLVDHPEYTHWSKFPVGAFSIRKKTVTNESGSVFVTTTMKLAVNTADRVIVEQQVTVVRPEVTNENPPQEMDFPAKFRLPKSITMDVFRLPSQKAKLVGEEEVAVAGKAFQCEVFEWQESNEAGPMTVKVWRSNDMPGRLVREETLILSDGTKTEEFVTEVHIPTT